MAARSGPSPGAQIVELRRLAGRELDPLLLEETVEWQRELDWDFGRSADLIRQFADGQALRGSALVDQGEVVGYGYSVLEDHKGLIGDLYVRPAWRDGSSDVQLFRALLDSLIETPRIKRIESQLMMAEPWVGEALQRERGLELHARMMMSFDCAAGGLQARYLNRRRFHFETWSDHHHESAATVIALAYKNHVDGEINDQYQSVPGARRFIYNIVQYPGCGAFFRPGSIVAFDMETGWMAGLILTSFVSAEVGHVTQVCVAPSARGAGLGYELLAQGIAALRAHGARRITLTVTASNTDALELYRRCGFREIRRFFAYVWQAGA